MNAALQLRMIAALTGHEVRMRLRRISSLVTVFIVMAVTWLIIPNPAGGRSLVVVDSMRLIYNSQTLAIGGGIIASFLLGLAAFYLVRGRTREDLRCGLGGVLAATPVGNASFIVARWLGAVAYLLALALALAVTLMVLQAVFGEAPVEPLTVLGTFALMLLPTILLAASVAVLCDACAPLMGKGGDLVYFVFWLGQFSALPQQLMNNKTTGGLLGVVDVSGIVTLVQRFRALFHTEHFSLGGSRFDASIAPLVLNDFWTTDMVALRISCMLLMLAPLVAATLLFHRYSPDKVRASHRAARGSLWAWLNRLLQPATRIVRPLFTLAARTPGVTGQALADAALTLISNPVALAGMLVIMAFGVAVPATQLGGVLAAAVLCWGILISDLPVRDHQSATEGLTAAVNGGAIRRYLRHALVSCGLGLMCTLPVWVRWLAEAPFRALVLATGLLALSAAASLLGRLTNTGRTFLALFLFGFYLAINVREVAWFDVVGFNGSADLHSVAAQLAFGVAAFICGHVVNQRKANA